MLDKTFSASTISGSHLLLQVQVVLKALSKLAKIHLKVLLYRVTICAKRYVFNVAKERNFYKFVFDFNYIINYKMKNNLLLFLFVLHGSVVFAQNMTDVSLFLRADSTTYLH